MEVFRYLSVYPETAGTKVGKITTEEHIDFNSKKKQKIIDEILDLMKSASVDCKLNEPEIQGDYKCLDFGDSDELAYNPKYSKNSAVEVRKKKIEYTPGFINLKKRYIILILKKTNLQTSNKTRKMLQMN